LPHNSRSVCGQSIWYGTACGSKRVISLKHRVAIPMSRDSVPNLSSRL
jgi:hypothetical protein